MKKIILLLMVMFVGLCVVSAGEKLKESCKYSTALLDDKSYIRYGANTRCTAYEPTACGEFYDQVLMLQVFLRDYYNLPESFPTSYFGPRTHFYVQKFKKEHGLTPVSTVGPATIKKIKEVCSSQNYINKQNRYSLTVPTSYKIDSANPACVIFSNNTNGSFFKIEGRNGDTQNGFPCGGTGAPMGIQTDFYLNIAELVFKGKKYSEGCISPYSNAYISVPVDKFGLHVYFSNNSCSDVGINEMAKIVQDLKPM